MPKAASKGRHDGQSPHCILLVRVFITSCRVNSTNVLYQCYISTRINRGVCRWCVGCSIGFGGKCTSQFVTPPVALLSLPLLLLPLMLLHLVHGLAALAPLRLWERRQREAQEPA